MGARKNTKQKIILAISPHTDDAELGVGATLAKLNDIHTIYIAHIAPPYGVTTKEADAQLYEASKKLGNNITGFLLNVAKTRSFVEHRQKILDVLISLKKEINPNVVFCPSSKDFHQDHHVVYQETIRAFRSDANIILGYDFPWDYTEFNANFFIGVNSSDLQKKIEAIQCYKNEIKRCKVLNPNVITSLAVTRGSQCNEEYAEAFEFIRGKYAGL